MEYLKHSDHTTPLLYSHSRPYIMYFHSSMATTTTITTVLTGLQETDMFVYLDDV